MNTRNRASRMFLIVVLCLMVAPVLTRGVMAQSNRTSKVGTNESRKWEYCVIFRSYNEESKDKKRTIGVAIITFLEETGYRDDAVRAEFENQGVQASEVYNESLKRALGKAFARLGNDGWEFVGRYPFAKWFSSSQEEGYGFFFKRRKR